MTKKRILAVLLTWLVCFPCILLLSGGPRAPYGEESLGWPNLIGFMWLVFLSFGGLKILLPKCVRKELDVYNEDEEEEENDGI